MILQQYNHCFHGEAPKKDYKMSLSDTGINTVTASIDRNYDVLISGESGKDSVRTLYDEKAIFNSLRTLK